MKASASSNTEVRASDDIEVGRLKAEVSAPLGRNSFEKLYQEAAAEIMPIIKRSCALEIFWRFSSPNHRLCQYAVILICQYNFDNKQARLLLGSSQAGSGMQAPPRQGDAHSRSEAMRARQTVSWPRSVAHLTCFIFDGA